MNKSIHSIRTIAIAGAGGLGSNLCRYLFELGTLRSQLDLSEYEITVYDDDSVGANNLLHQNFEFEDIGRKKVDSLSDRYMVTPMAQRLTPEEFANYDLVFSCVDNMPFRKALYESTWDLPKEERPFQWIDGRCNSRQGAVLNSNLPKEQLVPLINDSQKMDGSCLREIEKETQTAHTTPQVVAGIMAQAFLNLIRGQPTPRITISM